MLAERIPRATADSRWATLLYPIYYLEQILKRYIETKHASGLEQVLPRDQTLDDLTQFGLPLDPLQETPIVNGAVPVADAFRELIDTRHGLIGRVVGSEHEPSGSHIFYFWAREDQLSLDVGHIVVGFSEESAVIGVVDEPRRYSDLRSFLDDFYDRHVELALDPEPPTSRPEILVFEVHVLHTKHLRETMSSPSGR